MDTSKEYVEMVKKCKKIQKLWKPKEGDFVYCKKHIEWDNYKHVVGKGDIVNVLAVGEQETEYVYVGDVTDVGLYPEGSWLGFDCETKDNFIWLPRQDQLQEMVTGDGLDGTYVSTTSAQGNTNYKYGFTQILLRRCLLNKFHQWCNDNNRIVGFRYHSPFQSFESMEKLWLAFVMENKYNKIWNGKDWAGGITKSPNRDGSSNSNRGD